MIHVTLISEQFGSRAVDNIVYASRLTVGSDDQTIDPDRYIKARVSQGHESILEHGHFSFVVRGISRICSHQLVRHRHLSFSQESQRYVPQNEASYVCPPSIIQNESAAKIHEEAISFARDSYDRLIKLGIKPEDARFCLPSSVATALVVSGNARAWLGFLRLRLASDAQWEIRELAKQIYEILNRRASAIFNESNIRAVHSADYLL